MYEIKQDKEINANTWMKKRGRGQMVEQANERSWNAEQNEYLSDFRARHDYR